MRNLITLALALVLVDFLAATGYVLFTYGLVGWLPMVAENPVTMLLTFDLVINLCVAAGWMVWDAKRRGINPWPFLALTATTGAAGPLLYVILRLRGEAPTAATPPHVVTA
ncbi:MAG: DUF2834 domain-containing protein [Deltaproteobacteria bacterium]|nr:DUF2834 domain-containing protein [Deltaproteobacteria bacterium]